MSQPTLKEMLASARHIDSRIRQQKAAGQKGAKEPAEPANPDAVGKKTYWKNAETGEVGITEKGDVLPEGVETITKKEHDEAAGQKGA